MDRFSTRLLIGLLCLVSASIFGQQNYYWVGGSGSWTELTHWATTSGGSTKRTNVPTSLDDVFFDANSFSGGTGTVIVTDGAICHNMNWTGVTNTPTINAFPGDALNIYGSLTIPSTVQRDFAGYIYFKSTTTGNTINLGGLPLRNPVNEQIYFEGIGGVWTLTSSLEIYGITHTAGTLNFNGQQVTTSWLTSSGVNTRALNLGSSAITCPTWNLSSATGLSVSGGTSIITSSYQFKGQGFTYNNLIVDGTTTVVNNNTFNIVTLNAGSTLNLTSGSNQTLTNLVSNGTSGNLVTIESTISGSAATLTKTGGGTVTINYASIQDNTASPAATFTANNSGDAGNNTNWSFTNPLEPTTQASSAQLSKVLSTSITIKWTNGNGTKRLVVAKAGSAPVTAPTDGTPYTAQAQFGTGSQVAAGEFAVYSGSGNSVTITGLTAGLAYYFKVYEFNSGSGSAVNYLTTSPASINGTTLPTSAVIISNSPVSVCSGNYYSSGGAYYYSNSESFTQTLSSSTAGSKVRLTFSFFFTSGSGDVLNIYDGANTSAPLIGSYYSSTSPGTVTATNSAGQLTLQWTSDANTTSTGWIAAISCVVLDTEPTTGASSIGGSISGSSLNFNWTNGNGAKRIVVARQGTAVTGFTPADGTDYVANASYGSGTSLSGNYVVYNGSGNTFTMTNLTPSTTYYISIYEYNGANTSANYRATATNGFSTTSSMASEPTVAATNLTVTPYSQSAVSIGFTAGNGVQRIVVMRQGSPVNALPVDGTLYTLNTDFSTATDLGNGNKVVYTGSTTSFQVIGLSPSTTYYAAVFEFNGISAGVTNYLTSSPPTASGFTRAPAPTVVSSAGTVLSQSFNSIKFSWTVGNGARRIAILEQTAVAKTVLNGTAYTANSIFGQGSSVGTNAYVVYDGTGNTVEVTGLEPNKSYFLTVLEYNGTGQYITYLMSGSTAYSSTLKYKPTVSASNLVASNITSGSVDLSWTRGNGDYVVLLAREVDPITQLPKDSTTVNDPGSTDFGAGSSINGAVVIYKGTGSASKATRLNPLATYQFAVVEFNSVYSNPQYYNYFLTTNVPTTSIQTVAGKNYYWVGGKGKWSELNHWATTSGGSTFHTSVPTTSDDVFFDGNSFGSDADSVLIDLSVIKCRNMDWTGTTEKASLIATNVTGSTCWVDLMVNGSLKLTSAMKINVAEIIFTATTKGNTIDLGGKTSTTTSCGSSFRFDGPGGEWTLAGNLNLYFVSLYQGTLKANKFSIEASITEFFYSAGKKGILDLANSNLTAYSINNGQNGTILGGTIYLNRSNPNYLYANGASYRKVVLNGVNTNNSTYIMGGASIDSLVVSGGHQVILESGKTLNINTFILNGDTTRSSFIRASTIGSAATISKASGTVNISYVFLSDNIATGGAVFNANNCVDKGNVSGWNITTPPVLLPKRSAANIVFYKVLKNQLKMRWNVGDGTGRIVVLKEGSPVDKLPSYGTTYSASNIFASGADIGNQNYVVANGIADSVVISNLTPGKLYYAAVFEYNAWSNYIKYKTTSPAIASIVMVNNEDIIVDNATTYACNVRFYDEGGKGYYKNNKGFTQTIYPDPASTNSKVAALFNTINLFFLDTLIVYDGPNTSAPILTKLVQTKPTQPIYAQNGAGALTFKFKTHAYSYSGSYIGWEAEIFCSGTPTGSEPTVQVSGVGITNETASSMKVNFTKGNGVGRTIVARAGSAVSKTVFDGIDYRADPTFGNGANLGDGNFVVYNGANESFDLNGLQSNTIYHFAAFEFNGTGNNKNYLANPALGKDTTFYLPPTVISNSLVFNNVSATTIGLSFFVGNGTGKLLLMKKGGPITAVPENGKEYLSPTVMSDNSTVVASGSFSSASVFQLEQLTTYYFKIFDYNGNGTRRVYQTTLTLTGNTTTKGPTIKLGKISPTYCAQSTIEAPFSTNGTFNSDNKFSLQLSNDAGSFDSPVVLKDSVILSQNAVIRGLLPLSTTGGTGYKVRIISTSPVVIGDSIRTISIPVVPTPTFTVADSTFTTTNTQGNQWLRNGQAIAGATGTSYRYKLGGVYALMITLNGCSKISLPYVVTSIEHPFGETPVSLYPNPVKNELVIETEHLREGQYSIYSIHGNGIISGTVSERRLVVNTEKFSSGIYLIRFVKGGKSISMTFVKE